MSRRGHELSEGDRDGCGRSGQVCHHQQVRAGALDREGELLMRSSGGGW